MQKILCSALLLMLAGCGGAGPEPQDERVDERPRQFVIGERRTIRSEVLGEDRAYWVSLPPSYETGRHYRAYPVLYALDGDLFFHSFTGVTQQLSADATPLIPEMIVVGVVSQARLRDSTPTRSLIGPDGVESDAWGASGGGEAFQEFLERELVPHIENEFAASDYRLLAGYSLTGLPVLHNLFTRPDVFDAHIVMDASIWWDDYAIIDRAKAALAENAFENDQLFITTTTQSYPAPYITVEAGGRKLVAALNEAPVPGLNVTHLGLTRETHHSLATKSLYEGLVAIFDGYMMTLDELYLFPERIPERFAALSSRLGHEMAPPEGVLSYFGDAFLGVYDEPQKALTYFTMSTEFYPRSSYAWRRLGDVQSALAECEAARASYRQALALTPGSEAAARGLKRLEENDC